MDNTIQACDKALLCVDFENDFVDGALGFDGAKAIEGSVMELVNTAIDEKWGNIVFTDDAHDADNYSSTLEGQRLQIPHCLVRKEGDPEYEMDNVAIDSGALFYGKLGIKVEEMVRNLNEMKLRYAFSKFDCNDGLTADQLVDMHNLTGVDRALIFAGKELGINIRLVVKNTFGAINLGKYFKGTPKLIVVCGLVTDICVLSNIVILRALFPDAIIQVKMDACSSFSAEKHQMVMQLLSSIQVDVI